MIYACIFGAVVRTPCEFYGFFLFDLGESFPDRCDEARFPCHLFRGYLCLEKLNLLFSPGMEVPVLSSRSRYLETFYFSNIILNRLKIALQFDGLWARCFGGLLSLICPFFLASAMTSLQRIGAQCQCNLLPVYGLECNQRLWLCSPIVLQFVSADLSL